jgi:hypothetical protein
MRIEPIYLLAPKPKPPSIPTRRAFLIAGGTFFAGIGLGGACGYAAGISGTGEGSGAQDKLPESSGNAELDELRRLAIKAPIEELAGKWLYFTDMYASTYRKDEHLMTGIEKLVEYVLANPNANQRVAMARFLAQTVELGEPNLQERLGRRLPELIRIR